MTREQSEVSPKPHCGVRELFHRKEIFTWNGDREAQQVRHVVIQAHSKAYMNACRGSCSTGSLLEVTKAQGTCIMSFHHCFDQICEQTKEERFILVYWLNRYSLYQCTALTGWIALREYLQGMERQSAEAGGYRTT